MNYRHDPADDKHLQYRVLEAPPAAPRRRRGAFMGKSYELGKVLDATDLRKSRPLPNQRKYDPLKHMPRTFVAGADHEPQGHAAKPPVVTVGPESRPLLRHGDVCHFVHGETLYHARVRGLSRTHAMVVTHEGHEFTMPLSKITPGVHRDVAEPVEKSRKLDQRFVYQGIPISVENRAGSMRQYHDADGEVRHRRIAHRYGYIPGTAGADREPVDVLVGPWINAATAFIVRQLHPETGKFDEHKVLLGFGSKEDAALAYREQWQDPRLFGSIHSISMTALKRQVDR